MRLSLQIKATYILSLFSISNMSRIFDYQKNFEAILNLPVVQEILNENKELNDQNKILKKRNKMLEEFLYQFPELFTKKKVVREKLRKTKNGNNITIKTEKTEPTLCEPLTDNDDVVFIKNPKVEKITYDLVEAEEEAAILEEEDEESGADAGEEEAEEEAEEEEAEEVAEEEAEEVAEEEAEEVAEEEAEEEEAEEEEAEEEEAEEEEEGVFEIQIKKKSYYTNNEMNGIIYAIEANEDVGPEVGIFKDGKAIFHKKK